MQYIIVKHTRGHLYVIKEIQNQMKNTSNWFLNNMLELPILNLHAFQLCKYSSCCTLLHSSLQTDSL